MLPYLKGPTRLLLKPRKAIPHPESFLSVLEDSRLSPPNKTKLLYYINRTTSNLQLYIPLVVAPDILQVVYGESHSGFFHCYKIVTRFWYIRGLSRLLRAFIWHCPQCLQLQIR